MVRPHAGRLHRLTTGTDFGTDPARYDRVRPRYPEEALDFALEGLPTGADVLDLGAGTGILSAQLLARSHRVTAVDPDAAALTVNPAPHLIGTAEDIPVPTASQDAVCVAQAWHWFDEEAAGAEIARVLRPGGVLAVVINQLDVRIDWVLRLSRIMHAGDVYRPEFRPRPGEQFAGVETHIQEFSVPTTVEDVIDLARTRSYWLRSSERIRQRVESNISWYFTTEHPVGQSLQLPYLCLTYRCVRK